MSAADIVLRLVGAFYVFAGIMALRVTLASRFIDVALAAIEAKPPPPAETWRAAWLALASLLVLAGGLALLLMSDWAPALFAASLLGQVFYLGLLAPRVFDPHDPPDPSGRRQSINAAVLYAFATAFVLWAAASGKLNAIGDMHPALPALAAALLLGSAGYAAYHFLKPFGRK